MKQNKIKFPLSGEGKEICLICGKPLQNSICLNLGAMKKSSEDNSLFLGHNLSGFMDIYEDTEQTESAYLEVVKGAREGQADLNFCSTECLKAFFDSIVLEFKNRMEKAKDQLEEMMS